MARDAEAGIVIHDRTGKGVDSAARSLSRLERAGERMKRKADEWGKSGEPAAKRFAAGMLKGVGKAIEGAAGAGAMFTKVFGKAVEAGGPYVQLAVAAVVVGAMVYAAPFAAAALVSGLLLAIGGGVLAAGIRAAADSPRVKAAWKGFGDRAKEAFKDFGKPFEGPVARAAETFAAAIERMAPTLNRMGKNLAPLIDKLAPALAGMAERAMPGILAAAEASKPLFDAIAAHMPKIGEAIGKFFTRISESGPGATRFFNNMLTLLGLLIVAIGEVIGWLADMYLKIDSGTRRAVSAFSSFARAVVNKLGTIVSGAAHAFGWMPGIGPKLQSAAAKFEAFRRRVNNELGKIDTHINVTVAMRVTGARNASAVASALRKQSATNAFANGSFALAGAPGGGRVGGPVNVRSEVSVLLDGSLITPVATRVANRIVGEREWRRTGRR